MALKRVYRPKDDHGPVFNMDERTVVYVPRQRWTGWMDFGTTATIGWIGIVMWPVFWLYDLLVRLTGR
jgi:hypothetical protein